MAEPGHPLRLLVRLGDAVFVLGGAEVLRIAPLAHRALLPRLGAPFSGLAGLGEHILPVIDLAAAQGLGAALSRGAGQGVMVRHAGHAYLIAVDEVLRAGLAADGRLADGAVPEIDLAAVLDPLVDPLVNPLVNPMLRAGLPHPGAAAAPAAQAQAEQLDTPPAKAQPSAARPFEPDRAGLFVETAGGAHLLALACVEGLAPQLAVAAAPDPLPALTGVAIHAGGAIPVVRLDRLLGEPDSPGPLCHALVRVRGTRLALAVTRIGALSASPDPERLLPLERLLEPILPQQGALPPAPAAPVAPVADDPRYLVFSIGGQACALALAQVDRVQQTCRVSPLAGERGGLGGVASLRDRVIPLIDPAGALGIPGPLPPASGYVVVSEPEAGDFVLPVGAPMHITAIADAALEPLGTDLPVRAIARLAGRPVHVLAPARLAARAMGRLDRRPHATR
jgi:chemotaxis signal transduction protein